MDDSQWDALRLLANVAVSAWESETEKTKNNSPLFLEEPKVRKSVFKICNKNGQRERFVIGNGGFSNSPVIGRKRTTVGKKRQRLDNLCPWSYSFPLSSSPTTIAKKKRKISRIFETPEPSEMPVNLKNRIVEIGGEDFKFVLQKELSPTDVNRNNNRLSVPERLRARAEFIKEDEKAKLMREGMEVLVVDQGLREYTLCLKTWKMGKCLVYNLVSEWNSVVENNGLAEGDVVQLWSFRRQNNLCFALVKTT